MNKKTKDARRLWEIFRNAKNNGVISEKEYQKSLLLLIDKMNIIDGNSEKIDDLLLCLEKKIKSSNYDLILNLTYVFSAN